MSRDKHRIVNDKRPLNKKSQKKNSDELFPIVGIGASAGGLEALECFFKNIPAKNNMAFVIVTHLDPEHQSIMTELVQKQTSMPVFTIKNGISIAPNTVYVIPPNKNTSLKNGKLMLSVQKEPHYTNLPVNFFFRSLAKAYGEYAIAVILSGLGADGSLGVRDIKQQGGFIAVQDPQTVDYDSMPRSAINTGLVDYVGPAETLFAKFIKTYKNHPAPVDQVTPELQQVFSILRARTRYDFSGYKLNVLNRRIARQMQRLHVDHITDYIRYLHLNPYETDQLFKDLLISVTCFFRDPEAFDELKQVTLPKLLKNKADDYVFRAWIPGCATGEEVYSLAILLREYMDETKRYFHVQIFGTDIDLIALETARACVYPASIEQEVSPERLARFFIKEKNHYKVKKEIREMIIFGVQNLVQEPPFTKLDLLSCRNLLIYLSNESQRKLFPLFHFSLKPKGILFLGMSESASPYNALFTPLSKKWKIFERNEEVSSAGYSFMKRPSQNLLDHTYFVNEKKIMKHDLIINTAIEKFLLTKFVGPCMVLNAKGNIIFTHGKVGDYLLSNSKIEHANILDIVHPNIKATLIPSLYRASKEAIDLHFTKLNIGTPVDSLFINLKISHIHETPELDGLLLLRFQRTEEIGPDKALSTKSEPADSQFQEIEQELKFTKENLQASIEELQTSNEELQSTNEELQSINEELETSKEELQSVNEELVTVNTELQNHIEQIAAVNDDMNNLFNSTDIAAFFLDNSLLIKRFTPKAQELIHVLPVDIGRSFKHFATNIKNADLVSYAEEVLKTLAHKTIEVQTTDERWYMVHILPYRTLANMIDGIVITFIDITENKLTEAKLSQLNNELHDELSFSENILDTVREPLIVLTSKLKIVSANRSFYQQFILKAEETIDKYFYEIGEGQWDFPNLRKLLNQVLTENLVFEGYTVEHKFPRVGHKTLSLNARKIIRKKTGKDMILLAMQEITQ